MHWIWAFLDNPNTYHLNFFFQKQWAILKTLPYSFLFSFSLVFFLKPAWGSLLKKCLVMPKQRTAVYHRTFSRIYILCRLNIHEFFIFDNPFDSLLKPLYWCVYWLSLIFELIILCSIVINLIAISSFFVYTHCDGCIFATLLMSNRNLSTEQIALYFKFWKLRFFMSDMFSCFSLVVPHKSRKLAFTWTNTVGNRSESTFTVYICGYSLNISPQTLLSFYRPLHVIEFSSIVIIEERGGGPTHHICLYRNVTANIQYTLLTYGQLAPLLYEASMNKPMIYISL